MSTFGIHQGLPVEEIRLRSGGAEAAVISFGAVLRDLVVPARHGPQRVVLGLATMEDYAAHSPHFGAIAGRFANRIRHGRFTLDGETFQLPLNQDNRHALHGGGHGLGKQVWQVGARGDDFVTLTHVWPDGEAGFPGTLVTACTYRLNGATLRIELSASADRATPVNLCHHSYFNLDGSSTILDHDLELAADFYTPADADWIPTGEVLAVAGTPFDFRSPRPIRLVDAAGERVRYDHNVVLRRSRLEPSGIAHLPLAHAATLSSRKSGLAMEVWTTEPGIQAYDGFKVNLPVPGHGGAAYGPNAGLCLEPQHFPDSPNLAHFPSTILRPGDTYRQVTEYRFG
jgi:aldose 1-epimerase